MVEYTTRAEQSFIAKALRGAAPGLRILDVGGGSGRHASFVKELGHFPMVLEYDSEPLGILLREQQDIPAIQGDGRLMPVRDELFDVVLTIEVPICTTGENDINTRFFKEVHRVLRNKGAFLFTADNKSSYIARLKGLCRNKPEYESKYYVENVKDYSRKLLDAGFAVRACWGYRWLPFTRYSDNPLVPVVELLERALFLRYLNYFSPWLFFAAEKQAAPAETSPSLGPAGPFEVADARREQDDRGVRW
jgi:SAM-dependent methyltransferase